MTLHEAYFGKRAPLWWTLTTILCGVMPISFVCDWWREYRFDAR